MIELRKCTKCGEEKQLTEEYFYKYPGRPGSFKGSCRICTRIKNRIWDAAHREKRKEWVKRHRAKPGNKRRRKNEALIRKYKINIEEYENILLLQNGECAICGHPPSEGGFSCRPRSR